MIRPDSYDEREDFLRDLRRRLRIIESAVDDCRSTTGRLMRHHGERIAREFGRANEAGDVEWESERFDSLLFSLSFDEAMRWLARSDSPRETTLTGGVARAPGEGRRPTVLAPPLGPSPPPSCRDPHE